MRVECVRVESEPVRKRDKNKGGSACGGTLLTVLQSAKNLEKLILVRCQANSCTPDCVFNALAMISSKSHGAMHPPPCFPFGSITCKRGEGVRALEVETAANCDSPPSPSNLRDRRNCGCAWGAGETI